MGKVKLPADLHGLLRIDYTMGADVSALADHLEKEFRKNHSLATLVDHSSREFFISVRSLTSRLKTLALPPECMTRLVERFPTRETWAKAKPAEVAKILADAREDPDVAEFLLKQLRKSLATPVA